jgi:hypothetical protein
MVSGPASACSPANVMASRTPKHMPMNSARMMPVNGDNRRLPQQYPSSTHVNQGIGGSKVNPHIAREATPHASKYIHPVSTLLKQKKTSAHYITYVLHLSGISTWEFEYTYQYSEFGNRHVGNLWGYERHPILDCSDGQSRRGGPG